MFKLRSVLKRYARGVKILAERERIAISPYIWQDNAPAVPTMVISNDRDTFYFEVPIDRVETVCRQLLAAKLTIEAGRRVNFDQIDLAYTRKS